MVYLYSTIKIMHGPINIRYTPVLFGGDILSSLLFGRLWFMLPPRCKTVGFTLQSISVVCRLCGNQQCSITTENKESYIVERKITTNRTAYRPISRVHTALRTLALYVLNMPSSSFVYFLSSSNTCRVARIGGRRGRVSEFCAKVLWNETVSLPTRVKWIYWYKQSL